MVDRNLTDSHCHGYDNHYVKSTVPNKRSNSNPNSLRKWIPIIALGFGSGYWASSLFWEIQHYNPSPCFQGQSVISMEQFITPSKFVGTMLHIQPSEDIDGVGVGDKSNDMSELGLTIPAEISHRTGTTTLVDNATNTAREVQSQDQVQVPKKDRSLPSPIWWERYVPKLARIWHSRSTESWCSSLEPNPPTPLLLGRDEVAEGMIYIKTYKASSSTCEGIAWSIAHHVGQRRHNDTTNTSVTPVCRAYTRHEFADNRMHARRHPTRSLLWTFVRDPAARDLSHIYHFEIGRKNRINMTSLDIQKQIQTRIKGRQTRYLVPQKTSRAPLWPLHELRKNRTELVLYMKSTIFENYDFVGLTERMSESLAVMVLLWDLHPQDVIVLNSKRSGGFDDGGHNNTCTAIPKAVMTPELKEYFQTKHPIWNSDVLLYHAVNASLQMTINFLGSEMVATMVETIEHLQQLAQEKCSEEAFFPCSANGTFQPELAQKSCYVQDAGCGHECVDRVLSSD